VNFDRKHYSDDTLLALYKAILKPRLIEEKMLILLRQNRISKWFSGIGQEAIAVGSTMALHDDEYILPLHRNLGVLQSGIVRFISYLPSFRENPPALPKAVTAPSILAPENITS
jgi:hypothetical protein